MKTIKRTISAVSISALVLLAGCLGPEAGDDTAVNDTADMDTPPTGRGGGLRPVEAAPHADTESADTESVGEAQEPLIQAGIKYHNGPVMLGTVGIYFICYGNWSNNTAKSILTDFASNLGGSPWWNINTTYTDGNSTKLSSSLQFKGSYQYTGNSGYSKNLSDSDIEAIVSTTITDAHLAKDTSSIYFVLTSKDVAASTFCQGVCGWHTYGTIVGSKIKYALVGDAARCLSSCAEQTISPNGNAGADAMALHIAHEATEAATDPLLNAWYDSSGEENADKCSWTFGATSTAANGSRYNMKLGSRKFLIQRNWVNAGSGYCAQSY